MQFADDGVGPLVHRLYRVRIRTTHLSPEQLIARMTEDLDAVAPSEFATFQKLAGPEGEMRVGDEYVVRMAGPWDGPVRVIDRTPTSFRLATLKGHLEAGQIEFRARTGDGSLEFTIESWARSGDRLSNLMYTHLRFSKEVQLHMWTSVLERVVDCAEGRRHGPLAILTRRLEVGDEPTEDQSPLSGPRGPRARRKLEALASRKLNFDVERRAQRRAGLARRRGAARAARRAVRPAGARRQLGDGEGADDPLPGRRSRSGARDVPRGRAARRPRHAPARPLRGDRALHRRRADRQRLRRDAHDRRSRGARVRLGLRDASGPLRRGSPALRGVEVARHRRGRVPPARLLADGAQRADRSCGSASSCSDARASSSSTARRRGAWPG